MTRFIQLHLLTSYPPSNLNRDDLGQPKTALFGGVNRLRISSQSLKRAWRTSELLASLLTPESVRTRSLEERAVNALLASSMSEVKARDYASQIAGWYKKKGRKKESIKKRKSESPEPTGEKGEQKDTALMFLSPWELTAFDELVAEVGRSNQAPSEAAFSTLLTKESAVDVAMFGRMLASKSEFNVEAAVQVAHALGVHASPIEDDYFTAVDDLNQNEPGAAHIGETGFAAAVFYQYVCIDREQLRRNLGGDHALAARAIRALTEAALKVAPTGKQNGFGSRAYAHFALAEKGSQQPRSLALAFLKPIAARGEHEANYAAEATRSLVRLRDNMNAVYGRCADSEVSFDVLEGDGSLANLLDYVGATEA